jgi:hypothetical protein
MINRLLASVVLMRLLMILMTEGVPVDVRKRANHKIRRALGHKVFKTLLRLSHLKLLICRLRC